MKKRRAEGRHNSSMVSSQVDVVSKYILSARKTLWRGRVPSKLGFSEVNFSFDDGSEVFVGASLKAGQKGVTALYGPNGRGKTTALRLLAGYYEPQDGRIFPNSEERCLSFSGADGGDLPPYAKCYGVIHGLMSATARQSDHKDLLASIGLADTKYRRVKTLSSGQRKRLSLFRALVSGRDGILLDEPLSHLDIISQQAMLRIVQAVKTQVPIIVATHSTLIADHLVNENYDNLFWVDGYKPNGGDGSIRRLSSLAELDERKTRRSQ